MQHSQWVHGDHSEVIRGATRKAGLLHLPHLRTSVPCPAPCGWAPHLESAKGVLGMTEALEDSWCVVWKKIY